MRFMHLMRDRLPARDRVDGRLGLVAAMVAALSVVAGCADLPPDQVYPDVRFTHVAPFELDSRGLEVITEYQPPLRDPHVEHLAPLSPEAALRQWAEDRIRPVGDTGAVRMTITDAAIVEERLATNEDFRSAFTTEQAGRFDATMAVTIALIDTRGIGRASVETTVKRGRTYPEGLNLHEREKVMFELVEALIKDFDRAMEANIRQYFARALQ